MQKVTEQILVRACLVILFLLSVMLVAILIVGPKEKETWGTITGLLAVVVAVIAVYPALRVLEIQEDANRPRPTPYFDFTSRYSLMQLKIKNLGGGVAYDIHLNWKTRLRNYKGKEITILDNVSSLVPQQETSVLVGPSPQMVKELSGKRFEGECRFKDAMGKVFCDGFVCSVEGHEEQLVHDDELPKTLRDLQEVPKELGRIADHLESHYS